MSEQALRDALRWLINLHHGISKAGRDAEGILYPITDVEWEQALEAAAKALTEAGEPEMVRLLRWLDGKRQLYMAANPEIEVAAIFIHTVEHFIQEEFNYKLEDYNGREKVKGCA